MKSELHAAVEQRFGVLPNFFRLAPENPEITASLHEQLAECLLSDRDLASGDVSERILDELESLRQNESAQNQAIAKLVGELQEQDRRKDEFLAQVERSGVQRTPGQAAGPCRPHEAAGRDSLSVETPQSMCAGLFGVRAGRGVSSEGMPSREATVLLED